MLSGEIAVLLYGRYEQIEMLPLFFKEYMESTGSMTARGVKYAEYLENSAFPYTLELKGQPDEIRDYYPKMILTLDDDPEVQYEGMRRIKRNGVPGVFCSFLTALWLNGKMDT